MRDGGGGRNPKRRGGEGIGKIGTLEGIEEMKRMTGEDVTPTVPRKGEVIAAPPQVATVPTGTNTNATTTSTK
jgi:hypothetical protein